MDVPLSQENYWMVNMDSLEMSGASVTKVKNAVIDSGTSLLAGPKADVQALMTKIGAKPLMKGE